ncbi:MAG: hypothetical protein ACE5EU_13335 [Paracoccaceae bacterium]
MARWPRMALASAVAVLLPAAAPAQTADDPSFLNSLWSGIKRALKGSSADGESSAAAPRADDAAPAPGAGPPSLSSARWIGFTPVIVGGEEAGGGAWIAGPFAEAGATVWVADTLSGLTGEARLVWREAVPGRLAELSAEAGRALGLAPGAVANVTIYLAR